MSLQPPPEAPQTTFPDVSRGLVVARVAFVVGLAVVAWASLVPTDDVPLAESVSDKLMHTAAYAFLGLAAVLAQRAIRPVMTVMLLTVFGLVIEVLQGMTGYRSFDLRDLLADAVGATLGVSIGYAIRRSARRRSAQ